MAGKRALPRCGNAAVFRLIAVLFFSLAECAPGSAANSRFVKKFQVPDSNEVLVIAEGELEPRSIGSYALRVYAGKSKRFPTDDFVVGIIRPRNGTIEALRFADLDGDQQPEFVVIIRSAGSGGYLSADAFRYSGRLLEFLGSVSDLAKGADPIGALRDRYKERGGIEGSSRR